MSAAVVNAQYAVRGAIVIRAGEIKADLQNKRGSYPFDKVIMCNIGNPQALRQKPLTFHRQVLAELLYPPLMDAKVFPDDVKLRAQRLLNDTASGSIGAYTHSQGLATVRNTVCDFICERDGFTRSDGVICPEDIFLTNGASPGIRNVLQALIADPMDGIMIPIPQYPLYSASIDLLSGQKIGYYLDEDAGWRFCISSARRAVKEAKSAGVRPKGLVVINPGNPTGQVMSGDEIRGAIELAKEEQLVLMADEVYQTNIYGTSSKFTSFFKVLKELEAEDDSFKSVELVSYHSISKGILGECGLRGGYAHFTNIEESGYEELYKMVSMNLCPNTVGQCAVDMMCAPPKEGEPSYALYRTEFDALFASLKRRAAVLSRALNEIEGIDSQNIDGAMYAFPRIVIPAKAVAEAEAKGVAPDAMYCGELLEQAGICCVPGSGFGQKDGTFHLRTTILPPEEEMEEVVQRMGTFHRQFCQKYC